MGIVENIYYRIFPKALEIKRKKEAQQAKRIRRKDKANLLLEYEELLEKRDRLIQELNGQAHLLSEFGYRINQVTREDFIRSKFKGETAESILSDFDIWRMYPPKKIKKIGLECEKTWIGIFVAEQKLKLLGLDRRIHPERHEDEVF
jgi:hypothetical protein